VLEYVLQDQGLKILEKRSLKLVCDCSRERLESVLISLGKEEIKSMLEQEGRAEVTCHFCNKKYVFDADDLKKILEA
jgi:molecular chaperone Hsp33